MPVNLCKWPLFIQSKSVVYSEAVDLVNTKLLRCQLSQNPEHPWKHVRHREDAHSCPCTPRAGPAGNWCSLHQLPFYGGSIVHPSSNSKEVTFSSCGLVLARLHYGTCNKTSGTLTISESFRNTGLDGSLSREWFHAHVLSWFLPGFCCGSEPFPNWHITPFSRALPRKAIDIKIETRKGSTREGNRTVYCFTMSKAAAVFLPSESQM